MSATRAGPIRRYVARAYPTRLEVIGHPALLQGHVPPGWLVEGVAGAVSLVVAAGLSGCLPGTPRPPVPRAASVDAGADAVCPDLPERPERRRLELPTTLPAWERSLARGDQSWAPTFRGAPTPIVAPLFEVGRGRASEGCVVVAPPTFLPEDAALQVIIEELERAPLKMSRRRVIWDDVTLVPLVDLGCGGGAVVDRRRRPQPLTVHALDPHRRVGFTYLTSSNYEALGGPVDSGSCSVRGWDFKETADTIRTKVREQKRDGVYYGVFYDPVEQENRRRRPRTTGIARENVDAGVANEPAPGQRSRDELRQQVRWFLHWLESQGAI